MDAQDQKYPSMNRSLWSVFLLHLFMLYAFSAHIHASSSGLMHANTYQEGVDISQYWASEKLDGVRAYWDGDHLLSRQGNIYPAPSWFTAGFPDRPLDGELWLARSTFEQLVSIVRTEDPNNQRWKQVKYMVFDLPGSDAVFAKRISMLKRLFSSLNNPYIHLIDQYRIKDHAALMEKLDKVTAAGGEGLMLHHGDAHYHAGRTGDLLKVKLYQDAEAHVLEHIPGKGKFTGMLGALLVKTEDGKQFRIGTGFSNVERKNPPPIGSLITYKYLGKTRNGIPRFASFLRIRRKY